MSTSAHPHTEDYNPTLNTVVMVERALQDSPNSITTIAELKRVLPKQVHHNTVKKILEYLEESNKILVTMKGITWIHNSNKQLRAAIQKGQTLQLAERLAQKSELAEQDAEELSKAINRAATKRFFDEFKRKT